MGMYDIIEGYQVKLFYEPSFYNGEIYKLGGRLRGFKIGDSLPIKTLYYNYPENFTIFDYEGEDDNYPVIIVKNGKVSAVKELIFVEEKDIVRPVFSRLGEKLNLEKFEDFLILIKEGKEFLDRYYEDYLIVFPVVETQKGIKKEWENFKNNVIIPFEKKWYKPDEKEHLKEFGEWIYCFKKQYAEDGAKILPIIKKIIEENPDIIQEYVNYFNIQKTEIEDVVNLL